MILSEFFSYSLDRCHQSGRKLCTTCIARCWSTRALICGGVCSYMLSTIWYLYGYGILEDTANFFTAFNTIKLKVILTDDDVRCVSDTVVIFIYEYKGAAWEASSDGMNCIVDYYCRLKRKIINYSTRMC